MMKVKELMELLAQYNEDADVELIGGENEYGEFAELIVDGEVVIDIEY